MQPVAEAMDEGKNFLTNLQKRAEEIGAIFSQHSKEKGGSITSLGLKFTR